MRNTIILSASLLLGSLGVAAAGQPDDPGVFGRDRAAGVQSFIDGEWDTGAPGASEWGAIARERAGENGTINQEYKDSHGGSPNPDNDSGSGNDDD
jgi:hypothetical protein